MAKRKATIRLSEHHKAGVFRGFKKHIGGRMFYFGKRTDRTTAERQAMALLATWKRLKLAGAGGWSDEAIRSALAFAEGIQAQGPTSDRDRGIMLHRATAEYLVYLEGKCPGSVSPAHVARGRYALNDLKRLMRDLPLSGIGYDELASLTDLLKSRPPTTRGEPMSADTRRTVRFLGPIAEVMASVASLSRAPNGKMTQEGRACGN